MVGGSIFNAATRLSEMAFARYNTNGTLDTSFSGDGKTTIHYGNIGGDPDGEGVDAIAILPNGKIVVAGTMVVDEFGENTSFTVARLTAAGTLDTSFGGGDGWLRHELGGEIEYVNALALQSDGKIVVAGTFSQINPNNFRDFVVTRYNANGTIDN